jgi:CAAX prenyl protease-like protein
MSNFLSPSAWARVIPFALFMGFLALRGQFSVEEGEAAKLPFDARWLYAAGVIVVTASLVWFWRQYSELHTWGLSLGQVLLSVVFGVVVFVLWTQLTIPWMTLGEATAGFRPVDENGDLIWALIAFRWVGAALMVPIMEELFWRGFLMRWVDDQDFEKVDPASVTIKAMALSTLVFMLAHTQWLAAIVAGLAYAWLYRRTRSLWAPVIAHAVTNGLLGVWVVLYGYWSFW